MIPLAVPNISGREREYLLECVESTMVSSVGPFVDRLETMVAVATGATGAVATSAGTTGLHAALVTLGVRPGDLVILPSFTFIASANAIVHAGASPWLFDVTSESWTLDVAQVAAALADETFRDDDGATRRRACGRRVGAIMPVHTLGHPADLDALAPVAAAHGLAVVVDAAAALGARLRGVEIGAAPAALSVLSFNGNKTVTAGGGGAILGRDPELLALARHLTTTARRGPSYDHDRVGFNYRMTNLQAAVGCAQMERLDDFVAAKRRIDARYRAELVDGERLHGFPLADWAESACWFSGVVLDDDGASPERRAARVADIRERLRAAGVDARPFWKPVHLQPPYAEAPRTPTPVTDAAWRRVLTLPCSTHLTDAEQDLVVRATREACIDAI